MENITHEWLIQNKFHYHKALGISLYSKSGSVYVHNDHEPFSLRIQNQVMMKSVDNIHDFTELHRIITK